jgi:hypothetical protein
MPRQPAPPARADWSASKQAIVIGACIVSLFMFLIGVISCTAPSPGAASLPGSTVTVTATATKTVKVKVTKKPKPAPTKTVTVTARPKPRSADSRRRSDAGGSRNCTPGYSPCLSPASDYECRGGSGDGPRTRDPSESGDPTPTTLTETVTEKHVSGRDQDARSLVERLSGKT